MPVATSSTMTMNAALADSQQQFEAIKRSLPGAQQPGGMNRMMPTATATSTHQSPQQSHMHQVNPLSQVVQSQVCHNVLDIKKQQVNMFF